jgi:hypothetical protein
VRDYRNFDVILEKQHRNEIFLKIPSIHIGELRLRDDDWNSFSHDLVSRKSNIGLGGGRF